MSKINTLTCNFTSPESAPPFRWGLPLLIWLLVAASGPSLMAADTKNEDEPVFEESYMMTRDGVKLHYRIYPGTETKETIPIVLLHGWEGQGSDLFPLAEFLSKTGSGDDETTGPGHAVIVPDLRGHGASTVVMRPGSPDPEEILAKDIRNNDMGALIQGDMQAIKRLLRERHNEGKLNIELLGLVAVEEATVIAVNWAAFDWSIRPLPSHKLGQYVKAIVLVSPVQSFKGMGMQPTLTRSAVGTELSLLFLYGKKDRKSATTTKRLHAVVERLHPKWADDERVEKQAVFLYGLGTSLSGAKLLSGPGLAADENIAGFFNLRLVNKKDDFRWQPRENPFAD